MKLRFHSRAGCLVALPGGHRTGSIPQYIGRTYDHETRTFPATSDPLEVDIDKKPKFGKRLKKLCRRDGSLLPADEATALHCQVPWVEPVKQDSGEWQLKGHVPGWCNWPLCHPDKDAEKLAKRGGKRAEMFAAAGGKLTKQPKRRVVEVNHG